MGRLRHPGPPPPLGLRCRDRRPGRGMRDGRDHGRAPPPPMAIFSACPPRGPTRAPPAGRSTAMTSTRCRSRILTAQMPVQNARVGQPGRAPIRTSHTAALPDPRHAEALYRAADDDQSRAYLGEEGAHLRPSLPEGGAQQSGLDDGSCLLDGVGRRADRQVQLHAWHEGSFRLLGAVGLEALPRPDYSTCQQFASLPRITRRRPRRQDPGEARPPSIQGEDSPRRR